jgi:hypothetical protein
MSDLLQRMIDRTRAPLSAVQPILHSIYTPANRTENDAGPMVQAEVTESAAQPSPFPPRQTDERESSDGSPPMPGHPVETHVSPAPPAPSRREGEAPPRASATTPLSPMPQQASRPAPPDKDARVTPPTVEKSPRPSVAPSPVTAKLSAAGKANDKGPVTKTFVPQGFGSKAAKSSAKREDTGSVPAIGGSGVKPDVALHQDFRGQAPGVDSGPQPAQTKPSASKAVLPTRPDAATKTDRKKTMPSLAATMKWLAAKTPPSIEHDASAKPIEAARSNSPESLKESSMGEPSATRSSEAASQRENKNTRIVMPTDTEVFSTRQSQSPASKASQSNDRITPVEVNVSIGHIEVKSVQPNPPAPRRTPQRARVTLEEFLKHPHYGGPR